MTLLWIFNVLIVIASLLQGLAIVFHIDGISYAGIGLATFSAGIAIWQGIQANKEQKEALDKEFKRSSNSEMALGMIVIGLSMVFLHAITKVFFTLLPSKQNEE